MTTIELDRPLGGGTILFECFEGTYDDGMAWVCASNALVYSVKALDFRDAGPWGRALFELWACADLAKQCLYIFASGDRARYVRLPMDVRP